MKKQKVMRVIFALSALCLLGAVGGLENSLMAPREGLPVILLSTALCVLTAYLGGLVK